MQDRHVTYCEIEATLGISSTTIYIIKYCINIEPWKRFVLVGSHIIWQNHVLEMSQAEWKKFYDTWFERMQKCINHKGKYFEKQ